MIVFVFDALQGFAQRLESEQFKQLEPSSSSHVLQILRSGGKLCTWAVSNPKDVPLRYNFKQEKLPPGEKILLSTFLVMWIENSYTECKSTCNSMLNIY